MSLAIAFIGFGEVGQLFARELAARPETTVSVYDVLLRDRTTGAGLHRKAEEWGVRTAEDMPDLCRGASLVISAVTADAAVDVAGEAASALAPDLTYIDLNSVSPSTKRAVAAAVGRVGAELVEFAVMAPVAGPGLAVPILAGGRQAEDVAQALNARGMRITPVSAEIGVASATKLCRSIVVKGLEALMIDVSLAAREAGVFDAAMDSLSASYPGMDWREIARIMPERVRRHGLRRAAEMRETSRMMVELGLDGALAEAIARRHEGFASPRR